jgi:hypothetical protein
MIPITYKGVVVSLNPRNIPCIANERRTAGAPNDLYIKYFIAGFSIGEPYKYIKYRKKEPLKLIKVLIETYIV